jgi:hypothetical protein
MGPECMLSGRPADVEGQRSSRSGFPGGAGIPSGCGRDPPPTLQSSSSLPDDPLPASMPSTLTQAANLMQTPLCVQQLSSHPSTLTSSFRLPFRTKILALDCSGRTGAKLKRSTPHRNMFNIICFWVGERQENPCPIPLDTARGNIIQSAREIQSVWL